MKRTRKSTKDKSPQPTPQYSPQTSPQPSSFSAHDWWMGFLTSVLGTAIGVGLTFVVSKLVENNHNAQAQRITAMMVIDDIDKSLEILCRIREEEANRYEVTSYVKDNLSDIDSMAIDTLVMVFNYLVDGSYISSELQFSQSGEKVFQSNQDAWMNLNDMSFIRNVDEFYKSRSMLTNAISSFYYWRKPVDMSESYELLTTSDILYKKQNYIAFLREQLQSPRTLKYIRNYDNRMMFYAGLIKQWTYFSDVNKTLMNITDEDMEQFRRDSSSTDFVPQNE
ncbi:MAG: hypothetical protein J5486_08050 [Bacteroidaceae bacterium]|nr:hypothetical protein [Bacteroidaceae bacterium]